MSLRAAALLTLLAAAPAPAQAARRYHPLLLGSAEEKLWELQVRPGFAVPRGSFADIAKHSFTLHASIERHLNRWFSLGVEVGDNTGHRYEGLNAQAGQFTSNIRTSIFEASGIFKAGWDVPLAYRSFRPYFLAGVGVYVENRNGGTVTLIPSGAQRRVEAAKARGNLGLSGGFGLTFRPSVRVRLGGETRIHYYNQDSDLDGNGVNRDSVRYLTSAAVISWLF